MRTTVIPAQITTVEDKIAGSLNFTQILLLLLPMVWLGIVYILFIPSMHITAYKIPIVLLITIFCFILAIRFRGKLILEWVSLIATFNARPTYYIFNKNDGYGRTMDLPVFKRKPLLALKTIAKRKPKAVDSKVAVSELIQLEKLMSNHSLSFKATKKGGFNVAVE